MTHLYNIKNSYKTKDAHSQHCSNMRDYTMMSFIAATSCSLGTFTAPVAPPYAGWWQCARPQNWHVDVRATEGGSGVQLVPQPRCHNPPTQTPTVKGPYYRPATDRKWLDLVILEEEALNCQHKAGPRPESAARWGMRQLYREGTSFKCSVQTTGY